MMRKEDIHMVARLWRDKRLPGKELVVPVSVLRDALKEFLDGIDDVKDDKQSYCEDCKTSWCTYKENYVSDIQVRNIIHNLFYFVLEKGGVD